MLEIVNAVQLNAQVRKTAEEPQVHGPKAQLPGLRLIQVMLDLGQQQLVSLLEQHPGRDAEERQHADQNNGRDLGHFPPANLKALSHAVNIGAIFRKSRMRAMGYGYCRT